MKLHKFYYKVDLREPYFGNTMEIGIILSMDLNTRMIVGIQLTTNELIVHDARPIALEEFNELFND